MRLFTRKMSTISLRVSYQGQPSAYTYLAAKEYFNQKDIEINFEPCNNLKKVFNDIINGDSNYGFVPLESSSMGTIHGVYDMLLAHSSKVSIVGEFGRIEDHCLCARDNKEINELSVTSVICHPHILDCCSDYLDALDVRRQEKGFPTLIRESSWNSAAACCKVAEKEADAAAIGSVEAAQLYKLKIIASGIGNDKNAETRYVALARRTIENIGDVNIWTVPTVTGNVRQYTLSPDQAPVKASIALALRNVPAAIYKMTSCFALRDLNILKIESRPATVSMRLQNLPNGIRPYTQEHWDLIFYIDYTPSVNLATNQYLLRNLREFSIWVEELGIYPVGLQPGVNTAPPSWKEVMDKLNC